jgi:hypothetical protein
MLSDENKRLLDEHISAGFASQDELYEYTKLSVSVTPEPILSPPTGKMKNVSKPKAKSSPALLHDRRRGFD